MSADEPRNDKSSSDASSSDASSRDAATPAKKAARDKADAIVARREHPTREVAELKRPQTVLMGCLMAWLGAAVLLYSAIGVLSVDENSSSIDDDWTASEVDTAVQIAHGLGIVFITWAGLITVFAIFAFVGRRWGATALAILAGIVTVLSLYSLVAGFAIEGLFTTVWSISSATLVRFRERSRDWYAVSADAR